MQILLTPETTQRIREVLGHDVDVSPDNVPGVLARLAVEAPATYSQVLEELTGSQIRLDSEEELRRRQRRGTLRRLFFSWGEYQSGAGDRLLDKRHIAAAVPLGLALVTIALLTFSLVAGRRGGVPATRSRPAVQGIARASIRPAAGAFRSVPPRPELLPYDETVGAIRRASARSVDHGSLPAMLPMPALPAGSPPPGAVEAGGVGGRPLGSPVVVSVQNAAAREPGASVVSGGGTLPPVVYNRLMDASSSPYESVSQSSDPSATRPSGTPSATHTAAGSPSLAPGTRIPATLLTGAIVVPGGPAVPIVVETADPRGVWMGQAVLGPGDRVQMTLTLTAQSRADGAKGMALDPERFLPGLPGRTTVQRSSATAAMATAALQAASDYAQAAARQGSVGVLEGWGPVVIGGQTPDAWTYFAARLAQEFQTRSAPGGWVTTTEVPAGAHLVILITGAS